LVLNIESHRTPEENLGIYYLQAALKAVGIDSAYRDLWLENTDSLHFSKTYDFSKTLFIGISGCLSNLKEVSELIRLLPKNIPIVMGGYGGTFEYEELLNIGCEIVMIGEGDKAILDLYDYYSGKRNITDVHNITYLKNGEIIRNDSYPVIDLNELNNVHHRKYLSNIIEVKATVNVLSSKGCYGSCSFCSISRFYCSYKWRDMDIGHIIKVLENLYVKGARVFKFVDDSFLEGNRDEKWCESFLKAMNDSEILNNILFRISIRADQITDGRIKFLSEAGMFAVSCGIENGSPNFLNRIGKKASFLDNDRALSIFKKYGIFVQAGFMLFDDRTNMQELYENLNFFKQHEEIIVKGIFSEVYAAEGTRFGSYIKKRYKDVSSKTNGNYKYPILDPSAQKVHFLLKEYQKKNSSLYDKLIDPISAPKALSGIEKYYQFYELYKMVHKIDIEFFETVLSKIEDIKDYTSFISDFLHEKKDIMSMLNKEVDKLYIENQMVFTGVTSKFLL
ncbi:B12-binding domain-containing radical SAM protein, partial [Listeria monocytogenes]|nr:B12-binding domain-containing radical SAM protein [Listeria monocytogenes]